MACAWRNNHEHFHNLTISPSSPKPHRLATSFTFGAPQSTTSIRLTMLDYVSNYPKDFSNRLGKQLWAAAEGEEEMCLIDGEKYESRAQRNTLSTFSGPISFWALPLMEKGSPLPRKWTKKSEKFCGILGMYSDRFWVSMGSVDLFSWWKIDSPKFFPSQEGRHLSLLSWGTN